MEKINVFIIKTHLNLIKILYYIKSEHITIFKRPPPLKFRYPFSMTLLPFAGEVGCQRRSKG